MFNFSYFGHSFGGHKGYSHWIRQNQPVKGLKNPEVETMFYLTSERPIVVNPQKRTIYYLNNSMGYVKPHDLYNFRPDIIRAIENDCKICIIGDNQFLGTNEYIYEEYWMQQPTNILSGKPSDYLYMMVCFFKSTGLEYSCYSLRTKAGAEAIQSYLGSYFAKNGSFASFGVKILANLLKLTFGNRYIDSSDLEESFTKEEVKALSQYKPVSLA